jgi:hypothetical protein
LIILLTCRSGLAGATITREQVDALVRPAANIANLDRVAVGTIAPRGNATGRMTAAQAWMSVTTSAWAWHIGKRTSARWHGGQTVGYHSFVAFVQEKKVGVVVLGNNATTMIDTIGTQLLCTMLGEEVEPMRAEFATE